MRATDGDKAGAVTEAGGKARSERGLVATGTASSTAEKERRKMPKKRTQDVSPLALQRVSLQYTGEDES